MRPGDLVSLGHCTRVKRGELIVECIGGDHALCGPLVSKRDDAIGRDVMRFEVFKKRRSVLSNRCPNKWVATQYLQTVGDVPSAPAKRTSHRVSLKGEIQVFNRVGVQRIRKAPVMFKHGIKRKISV